MAHTLCMLDKQGDTHAHAEICNTYCFSTATMIRERASVLRYTYIVSFVLFVSAHIISLSLSFFSFCFVCSVVFIYVYFVYVLFRIVASILPSVHLSAQLPACLSLCLFLLLTRSLLSFGCLSVYRTLSFHVVLTSAVVYSRVEVAGSYQQRSLSFSGETSA